MGKECSLGYIVLHHLQNLDEDNKMLEELFEKTDEPDGVTPYVT